MVQQVSNRLAAEKSPYLLQHKDNPVHWFPWGAEALKKAQAEDKPVFLSIGYSTCHWCHVMAEESFENQKAAEILNNAFISIKVDREERPDVDQLYMASAMAITGQGGWPLSIFMFPDGRPFYCATYIPLQSSPGRTGFIQLLERIKNAWEQNRSELKKTADAVVGVLKSPHREAADATAQELIDGAFQALKRNFDPIHGGFGQAPKFPRPAVYSFLLEYAKQQDNAHASEMVLTTLRKMAEGGMRDHLGGGFHRYSVDGKWRVPHFEKMLYDQAQLTHAYLDAFETTKDPFYARVADETLRYTLDCLTSPEGGFYSAEDADSDDPYDPRRNGEGCYYLWKEEEIVKRIGAEQANVFNFVFGVEFDGNALSDPHGDFVGKNILYQNRSIEQAAAHFNTSEEEVAAILDQAKKELNYQRNKRTRPHLDDKIITSWNGMMIGAMARGGKLLQKELYIDAAWRAARFIQTTLYDEHIGQLLKRYRDGEAGLQGQLDDYVHCSAGLTQLYLVSQDRSLLNWAEKLTQKQFELFWSKLHDCFFDSAADDTLVLRLFSDFDGAEPAPNSVALLNLLTLGTLCTRAEWLEAAGKITQAFSRQMQSAPTALPLMLYGLLLSESP